MCAMFSFMSGKPLNDDTNELVPFGDKDVPTRTKRGLVDSVFDSVANQYDLMNDIMSGGIHRLWKRYLLDELAIRTPSHLLDLAGGTGDIARRARQRFPLTGTQITVCDINLTMLSVGRKRTKNLGFQQGINWLCADGECLPFPRDHFDACTLAFGLRNMTRIEEALSEIHRVMKPGGRFLCLEFTPDVVPPLRKFYEVYTRHIIPRIGGLITGDPEAYSYLVESIDRFPHSYQLAKLIEETGFSGIRVAALSAGIASLHSAWRI